MAAPADGFRRGAFVVIIEPYAEHSGGASVS
jgi:hypothetical protein